MKTIIIFLLAVTVGYGRAAAQKRDTIIDLGTVVNNDNWKYKPGTAVIDQVTDSTRVRICMFARPKQKRTGESAFVWKDAWLVTKRKAGAMVYLTNPPQYEGETKELFDKNLKPIPIEDVFLTRPFDWSFKEF